MSDRHPLDSLVPWKLLSAEKKQQAKGLGYSEAAWENNRKEKLSELQLRELECIHVTGTWGPRRVKIMTGDKARAVYDDGEYHRNPKKVFIRSL